MSKRSIVSYKVVWIAVWIAVRRCDRGRERERERERDGYALTRRSIYTYLRTYYQLEQRIEEEVNRQQQLHSRLARQDMLVAGLKRTLVVHEQRPPSTKPGGACKRTTTTAYSSGMWKLDRPHCPSCKGLPNKQTVRRHRHRCATKGSVGTA